MAADQATAAAAAGGWQSHWAGLFEKNSRLVASDVFGLFGLMEVLKSFLIDLFLFIYFLIQGWFNAPKVFAVIVR